MGEGPTREPSPDAVMHGKSPLADPAQQRLVEAEQLEQQNPMKTPPNKYTRAAKGGEMADPDALPALGTGEWDTVDP